MQKTVDDIRAELMTLGWTGIETEEGPMEGTWMARATRDNGEDNSDIEQVTGQGNSERNALQALLTNLQARG